MTSIGYDPNITRQHGHDLDIIEANVDDKNLESATVKDASGDDEAPAVQAQLMRRLKGRHIQMIAFGGVIGSGFFVALGSGIHTAGPAGLLISFSLVGIELWIVMQAIGEMSSFMPISGSFMAFSTRFVDEALGFAIGWAYWFLWATLGISEYNTMTILFSFWNTHIPSYGWILMWNVFFLFITSRGVRWFGEIELMLCTAKLLFIVLVMLCSILIAAGAIGDGPVLGFTYWKHPGAFANGFAGVMKTLPLAANFMVGSEMLGSTAGEASHPARDVPKAAKQVVWRILFVFILGIFLQGMIVPYDEPQLLNGSSPTARAIIAIAMAKVGVAGIGHAVTVFCIVANVSALNGTIYIASRALANLGFIGHGPKFLTKTTKSGVPIFGVIITNTIGLVSLLNVSSGPGVLFTWLVSISGVLAFFAWMTVCLCHIRFRKALTAQGVPLTDLPWVAPFQPYISYIGLGGSIFFTLISGWTAFLKPFDIDAFLQSYLLIPVFALLYFGFKFWKKTKIVHPTDADITSGRSVWTREDLEWDKSNKGKWLRRGRELFTG